MFIIRNVIFIRTPLREGNVVISVGECVYVFQPHVFLPFYLPAYDGRLGHVSISMQYDSMFAFIHLFCMHRARRIILTALYFDSELNTCYL